MKLLILFRGFSLQAIYSATWRRARQFLAKMKNTIELDLFINPISFAIYLMVLLSIISATLIRIKAQRLQ